MVSAASALAARQQVYAQLSTRFPAKSIAWVRTVRWDPACKIDLDEFDTDDRDSWAASHQSGQVAHEVQKWKDGTADPIVAIRVGNSSRLIIVDGHHRLLGRERMHKKRALTWVGYVPDDKGPWMETHLSQFGGPSG